MCLVLHDLLDILGTPVMKPLTLGATFAPGEIEVFHCLLYTSDAADEEDSGDLGGRPITKKKKH